MANKYKQLHFLSLGTFLLLTLTILSSLSLQATSTTTHQLFLPIIQDSSGLSSTTLIPFSSQWKYLDDGSNPNTAWRTLPYDDSTWQTGFAEFGYGDGDENTIVNFGPDSNNKQISTYFRRTFTIDTPADYKTLTLSLLRDDGAVVYLNNQEILRSNMPSGTITTTTLALTPIPPTAEKEFQTVNIASNTLISGTNVLAVEIHQAQPTSSDISFNLTLSAMSTTPKPVRFAAIGDYGRNDPSEQAVADLIQNWEPDFILTLGDNSYGATDIDDNVGKYYADYINNYTGAYGSGSPVSRFYPAMGNHDYTDGSGAQTYLDYFTLPSDESSSNNERYYDFVRGNVHFFVLDGNQAGIGSAQGNLTAPGDGQSPTSAQGVWLQNALANSTATWKIVYLHYAPYSSSAHGNETVALNMRWPFQAWGATAVFGGHDHTYERFNIDNIPYFVNGLGAEATNRFCGTVAVDPASEICHERIPGALFVEANSCQITFQFITYDNIIIDTYTQNKATCP